jgi:hypothetical protein
MPDDPISVSRDEFDLLLRELETAGIPLKADRTRRSGTGSAGG